MLTKHSGFAYTAGQVGICEENSGYRALGEMPPKFCGKYKKILTKLKKYIKLI
jgi:hypothetical protein